MKALQEVKKMENNQKFHPDIDDLSYSSAIAIPRRLVATLVYRVRKDIVEPNIRHDANARLFKQLDT